MTTRHRPWTALLTASVASAAAIASAVGVFGRGDGATVLVTSVRGETYPMATTGVYAWNAQRLVAEGVGWDAFTLFVVSPATIATAAFVARGSLRARLVALGALAYFFYQYLMYATTWALGPLFPAFVAIFAASLAGLAWIGSTLARERLAERFSPGFPRRSAATLAFLLAALLLAMWIPRIAAGLRGDLAGAMVLGQTTLVVQALDLGLLVPLAVVTGVTVLRRRAVGYVLAAVFAVKAFAMASAICAMVLVAWRVEGTLDAAPLAIFASAAAASLALAWKIVTSADAPVRPPSARPRRSSTDRARAHGEAHATA